MGEGRKNKDRRRRSRRRESYIDISLR